MRRGPVALLLWLLPLAPALAAEGVIRGEVRVTTVTPDGQRAEKADRRDVVVYIPGFEERVPPGKPVEMRQVDKTFIPDVLVITVGQSVDFFNADARFHNVFSRSRAANFDLGTFKEGSKIYRFNEPGLVDVYCNIHESMVATLLVVPNRAFAKTGPDGKFELRHVPPGKHTVFAWIRNGTPTRAEVTVTPDQPATLQLALEQKVGVVEKHKDKHGKDYKPRAGYND